MYSVGFSIIQEKESLNNYLEIQGFRKMCLFYLFRARISTVKELGIDNGVLWP